MCNCSCNCNECDCVTYTVELLIETIFPGITFNLNNLSITAFAAEKDCEKFTCEKGNNLRITPFFLPATPPPINIGTISMDIRNFKLPKVLLTFSGDISLSTPIAITFNSYFKVIRDCNGISQELPFRFSAINLGPNQLIEMTESFASHFCDNSLDCCNGCVTYTVQFVAVLPIPARITLYISNVVLSAFIDDECS